ncbi:MAG: uncharacterized protein QOE58_1911 [Actinomycetota bacterium]|jgi:uncharacterized protein YqgC (DUF456 family)|nr:uncharacterized protein [Actinomycetota bacterium]
MDALTVVVGLMMVVGLVGIVVPLLPGLLLVWVAVLIWASQTQSPAGWALFGVATILALSGSLLQYLLPGRRMAKAGVTTSTTMAGAVLAIVGFFVIPVVGGFLGFPLGIYLAERVKRGDHAAAWLSTKHALKAIGLSMGIELLTGLAIATTWVIGVVITR